MPAHDSRRSPGGAYQILTELCTRLTADSIMRTVSLSQFGSWPRYGPVARDTMTPAARSRSSAGSTLVSNTCSQRLINRVKLTACSAVIRCIVDR